MTKNFLSVSSLAQTFFFKIRVIVCFLYSDAISIRHVSVAFLEEGDEVSGFRLQ